MSLVITNNIASIEALCGELRQIKDKLKQLDMNAEAWQVIQAEGLIRELVLNRFGQSLLDDEDMDA